jgi:hypothetical protein
MANDKLMSEIQGYLDTIKTIRPNDIPITDGVFSGEQKD